MTYIAALCAVGGVMLGFSVAHRPLDPVAAGAGVGLLWVAVILMNVKGLT